MASKLVMPKFGLSMTEGRVMRWLKNEGERVEKGEDVLEIETEKLTNTVTALEAGVLLRIVAAEGDVLPIAATLAYIGEPGEMPPEEAPGALSETAEELSDTGNADAAQGHDGSGTDFPRQTHETSSAAASQTMGNGSGAAFASGERRRISPAARVLARELGIDSQNLSGSGPLGRIVKADVLAYAEKRPGKSADMAGAQSSPQSIAYAGMRKAIGENMSKSHQIAPTVTHHVRADVTRLLELREDLNYGLGENALKISLTAFITKITAKAIRRHPIMNSRLALDEGRIYSGGDINIGIATALENGLVVPVVRYADKKNLVTINKEIKALSETARNGRLLPEQMQGGTFTITNVGAYGSVDAFTPIINQPESAILGVCRTRKEPLVIGDKIEIRSCIGLSLTFDHRVIDGAPAAEFLAELLDLLEHPAAAVFVG